MEYNLKKDIEFLKTIRDMNDEQVSNFLGISRMTLNRWMNNKSKPSKDSLEKIYNKIYEENIDLSRIKEEMYGSSLKNNHVLLFHGARNGLQEKPSINFSDKQKDFGKGFYLAESFDQSASFVINSIHSSIYIFDFNKENAKIKEYNVSKEWMLLITYFREKLKNYQNEEYLNTLLDEIKDVDVIIAPIADNTMYSVLDDFTEGKITELQCLNALSANRLGKQYVFLNNKIINSNLKMLEKCYFSTKEREYYIELRKKENEIGKNKVKLALREYAGKGKYIEEMD